MSWVRSGECNRCGDCCAGCPLFEMRGDIGHCTDRLSKIYLGGCNVWPDHPRIPALYKRCSYSFTWTRDDGLPLNPYSWEGWEDEFKRFGQEPLADA